MVRRMMWRSGEQGRRLGKRKDGIEGRKPRQKGRAGENVIERLNWIERGMVLGIVEHDVV